MWPGMEKWKENGRRIKMHNTVAGAIYKYPVRRRLKLLTTSRSDLDDRNVVIGFSLLSVGYLI